MRKPLLLLICLFIFGCDSKVKEENVSIAIKPPTKEIEAVEVKIDSLPTVKTIDTTTQLKGCDCGLKEYGNIRSADIRFHKSEYFIAKNDSLFAKWSNDSLADTVKSIEFVGFDTIPATYRVFTNVENISIEYRGGKIYGLDLFPKLKTIHFFGSVIDLNTDEKWLDQIEVFFAEKTKFTGIESFAKMSSVRTLHLAFSGFDKFPKDFDELVCINELTLGAYSYGSVDLTELDVSKKECLTKIDIVSWGNVFNGIPKGLKNSNIKDLNIKHPKLTTLEKAALKEINARL